MSNRIINVNSCQLSRYHVIKSKRVFRESCNLYSVIDISCLNLVLSTRYLNMSYLDLTYMINSLESFFVKFYKSFLYVDSYLDQILGMTCGKLILLKFCNALISLFNLSYQSSSSNKSSKSTSEFFFCPNWRY